MKGYLKGRYGYQNFGDDMMLFGVLDRIQQHYDIEEIVIEVGDKEWMEQRLRINEIFLPLPKEKITLVSINQHGTKYLTHALNILSVGKYKSYMKFFGGGEVLNDERNIVHGGRNIGLLYHHSIKKGNFVLLGGIGTPRKKWTEKLYELLLPKAQQIVTREKFSYQVARDYTNKVTSYQDFSTTVIDQALSLIKSNQKLQDMIKTIAGNKPYVLLNSTSNMLTRTNSEKFKEFMSYYPDHQPIFFPCATYDDTHIFETLQAVIPDIKIFDWTHRSLLESLALFYYAKAGMGVRLHFLYPLKYMEKSFTPLVYKDKVRKMIIEE